MNSTTSEKSATSHSLSAIEGNENQRCAAIDIGSNSMRLVVAEVLSDTEYRVLDEERESTRLARSLSKNGRMDDESMALSLEALRRFKTIADGFGAHHTRTIATCAIREAENGEEFCRRAKDEIGIDVEVISAQEEGQLAFKSVAQAFDLNQTNVAIADIGGGSTEIVFACGGHVEGILPTGLGCVRVTEEYGLNEELFTKPERLQDLVKGIDKELKPVVKNQPFVPQVLYGTGGTFTALAGLLIARRGETDQVVWGYTVHRADVSHLLDDLSKTPLKNRKSLPGMNSDRADIIIGGIAIIDRLMHRLDVNTLRIHDRGVRDGMMLAMIESIQSGNSNSDESSTKRTHAIQSFAQSCGVDMVHTLHVANLAKSLYQQLAKQLHLPEIDDELIYAAAILQDVGYLINYEKHHKHSYRLILNSQLPGVSRQSLEIVANVARYHRGSNPKKRHANFARLCGIDQQRVRQMAAILRIAGALDRSHRQQVHDVQVDCSGEDIEVTMFASGDVEVDLWSVRSRTDLFERAFERQINFQAVQAINGASVS